MPSAPLFDARTAPLDAANLTAFIQSVEAGSLSRAAAELGLPRATLSRRLDRLEERLGVRLLRRTTRSLAMTAAGEALYPRARHALEVLRETEAAIHPDGELRGTIRISVPPMQTGGLHEFLCGFLAAHPCIRLEVSAGTPMVDLQDGRFDLALRAGPSLDPGLISRTLFRSRQIAVAAPGYLAAHGTPTRPADLSGHRCLTGYARGELPARHWPLTGGGVVRVDGPLTTNDLQLLRRAALDGRGIGLLPESLIAGDLAAGRLRHVLPEIGSDVQIALLYPDRGFQPPAVRALIEALTVWARTEFAAIYKPPPDQLSLQGE